MKIYESVWNEWFPLNDVFLLWCFCFVAVNQKVLGLVHMCWCQTFCWVGVRGVAFVFSIVQKSSVASQSDSDCLRRVYMGSARGGHVRFSCLRVSPMPFLWKSNTAAATSLHIPPSFDSVQSGVCIISLVPYANLPGPKYCSLTNPSFVFSLHTKHQSCFSTHATPQPPPPMHAHTH